MTTKKITLLVFLIFCSINVFAKYKYEKLADFEWNNKSGFETKLTHSGNYAILSFEILDNNRVAFLSNVEKNIKIYSKDGKFLNAFDLDFIPEDFVYNNNKFYVLSNYSIYEFNDSGALIKKYSVNKEFKFINRLSAFKNDLYVLTSDEKSYPVIKNSLYLDTISQINNETNGWLLSENFKCKTIKLSNNTFSLQISNQKNLNLEKIYDLDKKLATVTILGKHKSNLFLNIEYFKNEVPITIEREILVYSLTEKEIVNKMKLPNMYFIYMKHDIKINDNGVFHFIATPKKGILYQLIYDEKLNKDIEPNFKEEYHYNEHLLRSKEGSIKNSFSREELPISRAEIIQNAAEYESLEWTATSSNISNGIVQTPDGAYIDTPDWVTIGQKQKVPYKWGGWTEINTFSSQISNGVYAGDNYCESVSWGPTYCVGVDCSGLVSRAWDLSEKYGTSTLPDISTAYSTPNELKHGDIINKAGYHVRLVLNDNPTGTINTIESSAFDWRVSYRDYDINDLVDYTPRYYNYIQNLEMASPIVIIPNPMIYEEQVTATVSITNFEDADWTGNIYMAIHNNDGNFLYNIDAEEGEGVTIVNNETEDFVFQDILEFDNYNGPGTYEIHLKYQTNGIGDFYLVPPIDNYTNPIYVEIVETTVINVPEDYQTIQAGINASANGYIVLVDTGTYVENINYYGKNITVASHFFTTQDTSYISQTIIDGNQNGSVVKFRNGEDSTAVFIGFKITNGNSENGGGIYCYSDSSLILENVTIIENSADEDGGGICCRWYSSPSLENVTITGNSASENGGGIFCWWSSPSLVNVTIIENSADEKGGGIYCDDSSIPILIDVTIIGNSAPDGGGIFCHYSSQSLENVTIKENSADYGGGIYCYISSISMENVAIRGNSAADGGGGIFCHISNLSMENVAIRGNNAGSLGGGIYCWNSSPSLLNVTITDNFAPQTGGGIYCNHNSSPSLINVTITGNSAADYGGGIYCRFSSSPSLKNCILWNDSPQEIYFYEDSYPNTNTITISYSDVHGGESGIITNNSGTVNWLEGNIDADPLFIDPVNGDYHLTENSPCIDAGDPDSPLDPDGTIADMGAYYYDQSNAPSCAAFYADKTVDIIPAIISFFDQSSPIGTINSWLWDFGDETTETIQNPVHTYNEAGFYTVSLIVSNLVCSDTLTYYNYITVYPNTSLIWSGDTDYSGSVDEADIDAIAIYFQEQGTPRDIVSFEWIGNDYPTGWEEPFASLADCNGDGEVNITDVLAICLNWNKTHSTVLESSFIPKNLEQYRDNFVEIYNSLGNSEIEIKIRNHIAEKFDLPIIEIIKENYLGKSFPNPFNQTTEITFGLKDDVTFGKIKIFNIKGQLVKQLEIRDAKYGTHTIVWNGKEKSGKYLSNGIYFYQLETNNWKSEIKKMIYMR